MADFGNVETMLAGVNAEDRRIFNRIFQYILRDVRFGRADDGEPSKNFGGGFYSATTPATANGSNASLTGLPATVGANSTGLATGYGDQGAAFTLLANTGAVTVYPYSVSGVRLTNANLSGKTIYGSGCYRV